jgi:hypothetical protein
MRRDPQWDPVRNDPRFAERVREYASQETPVATASPLAAR